MVDMKINGGSSLSQSNLLSKTEKPEAKGSFDADLSEAINKVSEVAKEADNAVTELSTNGDVSKAVISMEKADMSFQLMVEVRNKLLNAYEEVMRMQV
ncbi:MAG: flagellar hook-basal body complex protein FliE [Nitrospirae bacterium]|nr:flagellar hook-basal body complex protein FliE [Nitrospirota bacterium]